MLLSSIRGAKKAIAVGMLFRYLDFHEGDLASINNIIMVSLLMIRSESQKSNPEIQIQYCRVTEACSPTFSSQRRMKSRAISVTKEPGVAHRVNLGYYHQ